MLGFLNLLTLYLMDFDIGEERGSTIQGDWILYQILGPELGGGSHYTRDALYTRSYGIYRCSVASCWLSTGALEHSTKLVSFL